MKFIAVKGENKAIHNGKAWYIFQNINEENENKRKTDQRRKSKTRGEVLSHSEKVGKVGYKKC